ncbi:hypothetical protein KPL71_012023 [Citrus sinensis]|uniref:Uncharacterized protein n=1 Tax=Citrus sinensis TaxID=2711 RepID=A0ACB8L8F9_CITSI|nr:hypothetical protein KPL71_012023 [Citrus sinensis]
MDGIGIVVSRDIRKLLIISYLVWYPVLDSKKVCFGLYKPEILAKGKCRAYFLKFSFVTQMPISNGPSYPLASKLPHPFSKIPWSPKPFSQNPTSLCIRTLISTRRPHPKEYIQSSRLDQCSLQATPAEQYVTLEIPPELISNWKREGYTHLHLGGIRLILTLHGRKGLPVTARLAMLDTRFKQYQDVVIGTVLTTLHAGSVLLTFYPNFNLSLQDPNLPTTLKIPRQIPRHELIMLMPLEWISNYEQFHNNTAPIQTSESMFERRQDGTTAQEDLPITGFNSEGYPVYPAKHNGHFLWDAPGSGMCDPTCPCWDDWEEDGDYVPRWKKKPKRKKPPVSCHHYDPKPPHDPPPPPAPLPYYQKELQWIAKHCRSETPSPIPLPTPPLTCMMFSSTSSDYSSSFPPLELHTDSLRNVVSKPFIPSPITSTGHLEPPKPFKSVLNWQTQNARAQNDTLLNINSKVENISLRTEQLETKVDSISAQMQQIHQNEPTLKHLAKTCLDKLCEQKQFFKELLKDKEPFWSACKKPYLQIKCKQKKDCDCSPKKKRHFKKFRNLEFSFRKKSSSSRDFKRRKSSRCFICKKKGHFAKDCPHKREKSIRLVEHLQATTDYSPEKDELEFYFSEQDEPNDEIMFALQNSSDDSDSDQSQIIFHQQLLSLDTTIPIPSIKLQILPSKFQRPIPVIVLIDTGAQRSMLNPHLLPLEYWTDYEEHFKAVNGKLFTTSLITKKPIESHSEFTHPNPLWKNKSFFIKLPFKLNEDINPTKATHPGMSPSDLLLAQQECSQLLAQGLIEPTNSQWACQALENDELEFYFSEQDEPNDETVFALQNSSDDSDSDQSQWPNLINLLQATLPIQNHMLTFPQKLKKKCLNPLPRTNPVQLKPIPVHPVKNLQMAHGLPLMTKLLIQI